MQFSFATVQACFQIPERSIDYGEESVHLYAQCRHGPDGTILLDKYLLNFFTDFNQQVVLDAGCGAGPWSILAAQNGAIVHGVDLQSKMIDTANTNAKEQSTDKNTFFQIGDVRALPFPEDFFDRALSINLICNLPAKDNKCGQQESLELHLAELNRVLKKKGKVLISGPSSMDQVLTNGKRPREVIIQEIEQTLQNHPYPLTESTALEFVKQFTDVYRASFVLNNGKLTLVQDTTLIKPGQPVLRKIPGLALYMYYHSQEDVIQKLKQAGFNIRLVQTPVLDPEELKSSALGSEYLVNNPFFIIEAEKA